MRLKYVGRALLFLFVAALSPDHDTQFVCSDCWVFKFCRSKESEKDQVDAKAFRKATGKKLCNDPMFEKTNMPVKYDRELRQNTFEKLLDEIK